jgi:hypothetical protein
MNMANSRSRWSLWSEASFLSIGCKNSVLSIGSIGSACSIGSIGGFFSAFSVLTRTSTKRCSRKWRCAKALLRVPDTTRIRDFFMAGANS